MKIRTLIVDDEPLARKRLRFLLEKEPDVEILAECQNGHEAVDAVSTHTPDLMFLDVQMPGWDGFAVIENIPAAQMPVIIFTTAFEQHALQAFDAHALDYLLKPFKVTRFQSAVARAREHLANRHNSHIAIAGILEMVKHTSSPQHFLTRLSVKHEDRHTFVKVTDIDVIEAAGKYIVVHAGKENHILRLSLASLEDQLDPAKFLRISRSVIVNIESIKELQPMFKGEYAVVLHSGRSLAMTRGFKEVEQWLSFS